MERDQGVSLLPQLCSLGCVLVLCMTLVPHHPGIQLLTRSDSVKFHDAWKVCLHGNLRVTSPNSIYILLTTEGLLFF